VSKPYLQTGHFEFQSSQKQRNPGETPAGSQGTAIEEGWEVVSGGKKRRIIARGRPIGTQSISGQKRIITRTLL
jgi:hypothetical protein